MQEFSSVSVSSYEPGSLVAALNEQAAAGWDVIAIVPTGSSITAYLSRAASEAAADTDASAAVPAAVAAAAVADPTPEPTPEPAPEPVLPERDGASDIAAAAALVVATEPESAPEPAAVDPVDEPAGWAVAPESSTTTEPEPTPEPEPVVAAAASAAPAGWYADPSSRYELRYWDGGQWTEHVSRSGQQFTDPPVA